MPPARPRRISDFGFRISDLSSRAAVSPQRHQEHQRTGNGATIAIAIGIAIAIEKDNAILKNRYR